MQENDKNDHHDRLLPGFSQGNHRRGRTTDDRTEERNDLGNAGKDSQREPKIETDDEIADGREQPDNQAQKELTSSPTTQSKFNFVPEAVRAIALLDRHQTQHEALDNSFFCHPIERNDHRRDNRE